MQLLLAADVLLCQGNQQQGTVLAPVLWVSGWDQKLNRRPQGIGHGLGFWVCVSGGWAWGFLTKARFGTTEIHRDYSANTDPP